MNYSKAHQHFCSYNGTSDAYDNPEKYLGPNYASILNFWWYLESLTREQLLELEAEYKRPQHSNRYTSLSLLTDITVGRRNRIAAIESSRSQVRNIIERFPYIPAPVTLELMSMHTILEQGDSLIFVPLVSF